MEWEARCSGSETEQSIKQGRRDMWLAAAARAQLPSRRGVNKSSM